MDVDPSRRRPLRASPGSDRGDEAPHRAERSRLELATDHRTHDRAIAELATENAELYRRNGQLTRQNAEQAKQIDQLQSRMDEVDVCGHRWPTEGKLHRIAQLMSDSDLGFELPEADAYAFLARMALGFASPSEVFPDNEKAGSVPLLTTASLLVAYRPEGQHWWEYLDVIEQALEEASRLSKGAFPAVLFLARRTRALESRGSTEGSAGV